MVSDFGGRKILKREKSCGALVYRFEGDKLMTLLLRHRKGGHWSFPKGHVENDETEHQTALRETKEETGLDVELQDNFRHTVEYYPKQDIKKQVVYFLGYSESEYFVRQEEEISELKWVLWDDALSMVTFKNDKNLLTMAKEYISVKGKV